MKSAIATHGGIEYQVPDIGLLLHRPDSLVEQRFVLKGQVAPTWGDDSEPTVILEVEASPYPDNEVAVTLPRWEDPWPQGELTVYGVCGTPTSSSTPCAMARWRDPIWKPN